MGRGVRYDETEVVPVQNQRAQCGLFTQSFQSPAIIKAFNQVKFVCLCVCVCMHKIWQVSSIAEG